MFINLYIARPTYHVFLIYTCGLTVVIKRIRYVIMLLSFSAGEATDREDRSRRREQQQLGCSSEIQRLTSEPSHTHVHDFFHCIPVLAARTSYTYSKRTVEERKWSQQFAVRPHRIDQSYSFVQSCSYRVRGVDGICAEHLTVESYTVFICQQSYLLFFWYSITHSLFLSRLKPSFSANPSHCSPSFLLLKYLLRGFPGLFTVISEHICFLLLVSFLFLHFLVVGSVRQIKLTHVGSRAHVKIASRIVSYRIRHLVETPASTV